MLKIKFELLKRYISKNFQAYGLSEEDAEITADVLITAGKRRNTFSQYCEVLALS